MGRGIRKAASLFDNLASIVDEVDLQNSEGPPKEKDPNRQQQ